MGLFDFINNMGGSDITPQERRRAQSIALLQAGAGMLANNTRNYGNAAPAIGAGLQNGLLSLGFNLDKAQTAAEKRKLTKAMQEAFAQGLGNEIIPGQNIPGYAVGDKFTVDPSTAEFMAGQAGDINSMMMQPPSPAPRTVETIPYQREPLIGRAINPFSNTPEPMTEAERGLASNELSNYSIGGKQGGAYQMPSMTAYAPEVSKLPQQGQPFKPEPTQIERAAYRTPDTKGGLTFDARKAAMALLQSGQPELMMQGYKILSEPAPGAEYMAPFVADNGDVFMPNKAGGMLPIPGVKGAPKAGAKAGQVDIHIGGGSWQTYQENPDGTPNFEKPLGKPFNKRPTASETNQVVNPALDPFKNERALRQEYTADPIIKSAKEMQSAFTTIETAYRSPSPANDLAMATKYMKVLDPTSVVRESELAMAMNATGLIDRVYNYANMLASGEKLNPTQRKDFYDSAKAINDEFQKNANELANYYKGVASQYGLKPENVAPDFKRPNIPKQPSALPKKNGGWSIQKVNP